MAVKVNNASTIIKNTGIVEGFIKLERHEYAIG
jgi:hypothetical protein